MSQAPTSAIGTTITSSINNNDKKSNSDKTEIQEEKVDFKEDEPLNGIFTLLRNKCGGNPHTKGIINISSSTTCANHAYQVIDPGWMSHWVTENGPDQWIKFDFKTSRMYLTHYTIKTYNYVTGGNHMRSWVVEGSTNDNDWLEIDRKQSVGDLNERYKVKSYQCKNPGAFRYIRIKQTGKTHCDSDIMVLTNVEFFGTLRMD
ncbi:F5/8 type C domain containing protein [Tritrichomonas foetus]|uniref:F5/8 type C domain containing protein n=1 Tax=Tritrichomonas foetus TaxID=1144522 RepID=A0A1J4JMR6_9EUKA|nr:F5/8 type C domain containing protein [Tritrichomonas foetus]|eukprot:OHS98827.1 F5/8 type C domain containing protein [Tritrichomonas foetus]